VKDAVQQILAAPDLVPRYQYCADPRFSTAEGRKPRLWAAALPCLLGLGGLYQAVASLWDRRNFPPPGRLVDLDGTPMHLRVLGEGRTTVLLETGLGGMSSAWGWIQPEAAQFSRVVAYDRAGLGWSAEASGTGSAVAAARRLRALLKHCGILPPFVLVGHSMGGLLVRVFADLFPAEVRGVVLIDAVHPDQHLRSAAIAEHMQGGFRLLRSVPLLTRLGYVRLAGLFSAWSEGLPERQAAESQVFLSDYRHLKTTRDECLAWDTLCAEARGTADLGDRPLAVVTAGKDVLEGHPKLQGELAALSSDSIHLVVPGADHVTLVTQRDHARAVVRAIRHVVQRSCSRHPS
jgi:pimeloyl-ACP methyl ester carboxylesterase